MGLAIWAAAATGVQVGAAIVASRYVVGEVPPLTLALLRYAIGMLCLLPFALPPVRQALAQHRAQAAPAWPWRDLGVMGLLGIRQFAILIALLNAGLQHIGAAQAALIFSLFPLFTLLLSVALGRERLRFALLMGVLLSILGVALSLVPKLGSQAPVHAAGHWWGELAVLASAMVGAICSVAYRPYLQRYPTVPVSTFAMAASVAFLSMFALSEDWPSRVTQLSPPAWGAVLFIGVSSGIGYFLWLFALKHESPTRVTVFLALNPVTACLLGALLLGEPITPWNLAAMVCIALGLLLATRTG